MVRDDLSARGRSDWPFANPRPFLRCGLAASGLAFLFFTAPLGLFRLTGVNLGPFALTGGFWVGVQLLLLAVGILATAAAVVTQPKSPAVLGLAALATALAGWSMNPDWDSARLTMGLLVFIALFAAFLLLLPLLLGKGLVAWEFTFSGHREPDFEAAEARGRFAGKVLGKVIVVGLVLLHFVGIASAIMSVAPPGRAESWLCRQAFTYYQPYLQFFYLNNAYRFYSPEPGPATLVWFYVTYADGSGRWLYVPTLTGDEHAKDPLGQEFTRRLSIGESINQGLTMVPVSDMMKQRRIQAGILNDIPLDPLRGIEAQCALPADGTQRFLREYARYVARHAPSEKDPTLQVTGVKIYRVVHSMLGPNELAEEGPARQEPTARWTYLPFFQGEFTPDGELKNAEDPFLYWLIPIFRWPKGEKVNQFAGGQVFLPTGGEYDVRDYLEKHARLGRQSEETQP